MDTLEKNQKAFGAQSRSFSSDGTTYADMDGLEWMLKDLPLSDSDTALDIATGTGEFARALSPHVSTVIGLDATDEMMNQGKDFVNQAGIKNICFEKGVVQDLPYADESFDIVSCRYAFHHFADPKPVIAEMVRVCKNGGHIIIVDIIVPDESTEAEYNYHEWLCDQSHTRCLRNEEFHSYFELFDLEITSARSRDLNENLIEWMDFSLTENAHRKKLIEHVKSELSGGAKTGLGPYQKNSVLYFKQLDLAIIGRKLPATAE